MHGFGAGINIASYVGLTTTKLPLKLTNIYFHQAAISVSHLPCGVQYKSGILAGHRDWNHIAATTSSSRHDRVFCAMAFVVDR